MRASGKKSVRFQDWISWNFKMVIDVSNRNVTSINFIICKPWRRFFKNYSNKFYLWTFKNRNAQRVMIFLTLNDLPKVRMSLFNVESSISQTHLLEIIVMIFRSYQIFEDTWSYFIFK